MSQMALGDPLGTVLATVAFPERLVALRHERGLTQQALSTLAELHVIQIRRYEAGSSQPSLDALRRIAIALSVSTDVLVFDQDERGPDEDLRLPFEAASQLDPDEKRLVRELINGLRLKREVQRLAAKG